MEVDSVCVFAQPQMYNIFVPTKKQVVSIGLFSFNFFLLFYNGVYKSC